MDHVKRRILTHSQPAIDRLRRHRRAVPAVSAIFLFGMVAVSAIAPLGRQPVADVSRVVEALPAKSAWR